MATLEEVKKRFRIDHVLSVSEVLSGVRKSLEGNLDLGGMHVLGEVTNLAKPASGHYYFSLTDGERTLSCTLFRRNHRHGFELEDGMQILVVGSMTTHPSKSIFQLNVVQVYPVGEGVEALKFKQLKAKLAREGLFDESRKKALPEQPKTVGVVCGKGSDAERDVENTLLEAAPGLTIVKVYSKVSGKDAAESLVKAIEAFESKFAVDVLIVARGGGPKEDLSVFNDEAVVRAIAACRVPVVTGIGHETDYTLADFAADKAAITPTAAAKEVTGDALARAKAEKVRQQAGVLWAKKAVLYLLIALLVLAILFLLPHMFK